MSFWQERHVLVTGGASFIGSHLTDALVDRGAKVRIVDDLSSGRLENIQQHLAKGDVEFIQADLREPGVARMAMQDIEVVFHLAADHGGRGYQSDPDKEVYLTEDLVKPPYDADNMYGWAKLMAELTLKAYHEEYGMKTASCRYFTVYAPHGLEYTSHQAEIKLLTDMPTGPLNRVADNSLAKKLLGWQPQVPFREGLKRTIDWYFVTKNGEQVRRILGRMLTER